MDDKRPTGVRLLNGDFKLEIVKSEDGQDFYLVFDIWGEEICPMTFDRHELGELIYKLEELL